MNADYSVNDMYICFGTLHSLWSGNNMLCSLLVGKMMLLVMRVLSCVMVTTVSSILFDCFKCVLVYFGCVNYVVVIIWADIKGVFRSECVVYYRCGGYDGCMLYAAVKDHVMAITVVSFMIVFVVDTIILFVC